MWPLERRRYVVLAGRQRTELMAAAPSGLSMLEQESFDFDAAPDPHALHRVLVRLLKVTNQAGGRQWMPPVVDVLLETPWLPAMLLDLGSTMWTEQKIQGLLRHRLAQVHGNGGTTSDEWTLQTDHHAGDRLALGYGLPNGTKDAVVQAATASGVKLSSLQPAICWGIRRLRREFNGPGPRWWVWAEQDRSLIARTDSGQFHAFNAAGPVIEDGDQCRRTLAVESTRQGLPSLVVPATVVRWDLPGSGSGQDDYLRWIGLRAASEHASDADGRSTQEVAS